MEKGSRSTMKNMLVALLVLLTLSSCGRQASTLAQAKKENHEGFFLVNVSGKFGFIDKIGKLVINPQFDYASSFAAGLAVVGRKRDTSPISGRKRVKSRGQSTLGSLG
jgi:hypothetical protein